MLKGTTEPSCFSTNHLFPPDPFVIAEHVTEEPAYSEHVPRVGQCVGQITEYTIELSAKSIL